MDKDAQYILVADYVPLANKGEEAIIRGIEDLLGEGGPVKIGVFDRVKEVRQRDNVTVFPWEWIFRMEGKTGMSRWESLVRNIVLTAQMRFGYYSKLGNLVSASRREYGPMREFLDRADYVLVGHDGIFCTESCGIIHLLKKAGKYVGILGMGGGLGRRGRLYKGWLYRRALEESYFCTFRERVCYEQMCEIYDDSDKLILAPDPAFAMRAAEPSEVRELLESYEPYRRAVAAGMSIVGVTVREKGLPYKYAFVDAEPAQKRRIHAEFVAGILDSLVEQRGVFILFLPHSIESDGSDVEAARHVSEAMASGAESRFILAEDLGARMLKGIIRECDFLIGERAHSLIGSVSVGTPFLALDNTKDYRTHGIIGEMCNCEDRILDMDAPDVEGACSKALSLFDDRDAGRKFLEDVSGTLMAQLEEVCSMIKHKRLQEE